MAAEDDRALLRQIAAGDQQARRRLYASYRPRLWSYVYHQVADDADCAE
jgi:hypothetical protein